MQKQALGLVFSNVPYTMLAIGVFVGLFLFLAYMSQFLFFEPKFFLYVEESEILNFILIVAVASLSGIVTSLSIYRIRLLGESVKKSGSGFLGTAIGAGAGACSCGSIGFAMASAFGAAGGVATSFLSQYEIPLRLVSIAILVYAYYLAIRDISGKCKITKSP
ncbi:hypothetical protein DYY67_0860 [Candidatus Nitrosotalea sp. TS]|uniref:hypothetical protein n=1 Tax=Candidatus Nitrosotalea sp. TS TaxID=2341020 RepID=UPI0014097DD4|nr:hypothetical protein [Candidatus Nitrosotalea sp. TS]NHI03790.1 hypothetical protein [Candidatus Nitrosotalea sp. TS]